MEVEKIGKRRKSERKSRKREKEDSAYTGSVGRRASGRSLFPWTDEHLSISTITLSGSELLRRRRGRFVFLFTVLKYES